MVAGTPPIRAKKARYYQDVRFTERVMDPPDPQTIPTTTRPDGWSTLGARQPDPVLLAEAEKAEKDKANAGLRREPELPDHVAIVKETKPRNPAEEFKVILDDEPEQAARQRQAVRRQMSGIARQASLNPDDGIEL